MSRVIIRRTLGLGQPRSGVCLASRSEGLRLQAVRSDARLFYNSSLPRARADTSPSLLDQLVGA